MEEEEGEEVRWEEGWYPTAPLGLVDMDPL